MRGAVENTLRWFARIGTAFNKPIHYFSRLRTTSVITTESRTESAAEEPRVVAIANESATIQPTNGTSFPAPVSADAKVEPDTQVNYVPPVFPDQHEIQRRRDLIRTLFNDFWNGSYDKPRAFVERLDQAETYLNERLTALGEFWQLDANTRVMLGLPPRSN